MSHPATAILTRLKRSLEEARDLEKGGSEHAAGLRAGLGIAAEGLGHEIEALESVTPQLVRTEHLEEAIVRLGAAGERK